MASPTAAALQLAQQGRLRPDDEIVLCITGNGLKTIDAVAETLPAAPVIAPKLSAVAALVSRTPRADRAFDPAPST